MPEFILKDAHGAAWEDLDAFTQGYIEALFFTDGEELGDKGFSDLAPEALDAIKADCAEFQKITGHELALAYEGDYDAAQAGRDYWFTRNHHGVGYWDRDQLKANNRGAFLTGAADAAGEVWSYEGDCGKVFVS